MSNTNPSSPYAREEKLMPDSPHTATQAATMTEPSEAVIDAGMEAFGNTELVGHRFTRRALAAAYVAMTAQGSVALPSEATPEMMWRALAGHGITTEDDKWLSCSKDEFVNILTAMRAATPTTPVQDEIVKLLKVRKFLLDEYSSAQAEAEGYPVDRECRPAWDALHEVLATIQGSAAVGGNAAESPLSSEQRLNAGGDHAPGLASRDGSAAPVQDDDAEFVRQLDGQFTLETRQRLERIASPLSPKPDTELIEALRAIKTACNFGVNAPGEALDYVAALADTAIANAAPAQVESGAVLEMLRRVTHVADNLAGELHDPGTEALSAIYCARTLLASRPNQATKGDGL